ncbi:MAG TPA: YceI family protein [Arenimonas sp.]|uniref:YceI family protein n=1 Tax=Arenimonas sp. TaxID=1872635 RepID=UPI002C17672A|nr:YceI family protein [Arenimonas sp.]HMB57025.1 YceI family protein [Arenimonas sp.]
MRRIVPVLLLLATPFASFAADWTMQPGSTLGFTASYQGEAFDGRFGKFMPQIRFDPTKLADSRFDVRIALASTDTKNSERDEMLRGAEFFDSKKLPEARFVATKFRALGGNKFAADGALSLHGISKPVTLAFTWTAGAKPVLDGQALLKRLDFRVGTGDWQDTDLLPNNVTVKTHLVLAAAAVTKPVAPVAKPVAVKK